MHQREGGGAVEGGCRGREGKGQGGWGSDLAVVGRERLGESSGGLAELFDELHGALEGALCRAGLRWREGGAKCVRVCVGEGKTLDDPGCACDIRRQREGAPFEGAARGARG